MVQSFGARAVRAIESLPAHMAFLCTALQPANDDRDVRRAGTPAPGLVPATEAAIVQGLEAGGVHVADLQALGLGGDGDAPILACSARAAQRLAHQAGAARGGRRRGMLVADAAALMLEPEIYRWGLHPTLLRIAERYLDAPVAYDGALVTFSPVDGGELGPRCWHLDREDRRMIKLALYLNDVDEEGGPFQLLNRRDHRAGRMSRYRSFTTAELEGRLEPAAQDIVSCTGKAGTLVFADTAGFLHRGKPPTRRARSAIFFSYFRRSTPHPFYTQRSGLSRPQIGALIKGLTPDQQAAALWRDEVRGLARFIPPCRQ